MTQGFERRATIVARDGENIYAEATGAGEPIGSAMVSLAIMQSGGNRSARLPRGTA